MSPTLFKATLKSNWILLVIFSVILVFYLNIMITMYDPDSADLISGMMKLLPESMIKLLHFETIAPGLTGFLVSYYYGVLVFGFPLAYLIIVGMRMIYKHVDLGSMSYLLSTPNSRQKIALTQALYYYGSILVMFSIITLFGLVMCERMFPGLLKTTEFIKINAATFFASCAVASVTFFASCAFSEPKYANAIGVGIPIAFMLMYMFGNAGESVEFLGAASPYTILNPSGILTGETDFLLVSAGFLIFAVVMSTAGIIIFKRKRLTL